MKGKAQLRTPLLSVTPNSFPKTLLGENKALVVTVKNNGSTAAQNVSFGTLQLPFKLDEVASTGQCSADQTLDPGKSCTLKIIFEPKVIGKVEVGLDINYVSPMNGAQTLKAKISGTGTQMIKAFAGAFQSCIINELGKVLCWGRNTQGQLGLGNSDANSKPIAQMAAVNFGSDVVIKKLAIGDSHSCALLDKLTAKGLVSCWGNNANGRLGLGHNLNTNSPVDANGRLSLVNLGSDPVSDEVVDLVAGFEHTCALQKSGDLKCWGGNTSGQLGSESNQSLGSNVAQLGDSLKPISINGRNIASISKVLSVSAGSGHTCAVLESGNSLCWGDNFYGQLGQGSEAEKIGNQSGDMSSLASINLGKDFITKEMAASSGAFTCALSKTGDVKCFGKTVANEKSSQPFFGVLGKCWARQMQNTEAKDCSLSSMEPSTSIGYMSVDMGDKLSKIDFGALKVVQLSLGSTFGCALLNDKSIRCWGSNDNGQLGIGNRMPIGAKQTEMGSNLKPALSFEDGEPVQLVTGYEHACAVLKNNSLKCWGSSVENATGLFGSNILVSTGMSSTTIPKVLPLVYDGR